MEKPIDLPRTKRKYNVFIVGTGCGCYAEKYYREFVGTTMAVSAQQACNNVRYRGANEKNPNGGYSYSIMGDYMDEGIVHFHYEAEPAE